MNSQLPSDSLSRRKTWVLTYGTRRVYAVGYSHAHSRKLRREMSDSKRSWFRLKFHALIGASLHT